MTEGLNDIGDRFTVRKLARMLALRYRAEASKTRCSPSASPLRVSINSGSRGGSSETSEFNCNLVIVGFFGG